MRYKNINPLILGGVMIEITRKCNMQCAHCMRGDAQNKTITKEVIDALLNNVTEIGELNLTGGEPLLELDLIEYLVDEINRRHIKVREFKLITNGSIRNERIIKILKKFNNKDSERLAGIGISSDQYHDKGVDVEALNYYSNLTTDEKQIIIKYNEGYDQESEKEPGKYSGFVVTGRAKKLMPEQMPKHGHDAERLYIKHRIKILNGYIPCQLYITVDGGITLMDNATFSMLDENLIGNLTENSLIDIITQNNDNCCCGCDELSLLEFFKNRETWIDLQRIKNKELNCCDQFIFCVSCMIGERIIQNVFLAREKAHRDFPHIPMIEIMKKLPIPPIMISTISISSLIDIILDGKRYDKIPGFVRRFVPGKVLRDAESAIDFISKDGSGIDKIVCLNVVINTLVALAIVNSGNYATKQYWGTPMSLWLCDEFQQLEELETKYKHGLIKFNNTENQECGRQSEDMFKDMEAEDMNKRFAIGSQRAKENPLKTLNSAYNLLKMLGVS